MDEVKRNNTKKTTSYAQCPFCKLWKVRTFFAIKNANLIEKKICMNLECSYMEYSTLPADLCYVKRLKNGV